ncbi:hypothetical protein [Spirosoma aerolatum]|uniref:hypothetical protein n=1 Tax=Spirosoma aerolatum TaxID=1211326 RepID=UPI0009AE8EC1|nr:hypothetical protein [Spirosoma aerolatum]
MAIITASAVELFHHRALQKIKTNSKGPTQDAKNLSALRLSIHKRLFILALSSVVSLFARSGVLFWLDMFKLVLLLTLVILPIIQLVHLSFQAIKEAENETNQDRQGYKNGIGYDQDNH